MIGPDPQLENGIGYAQTESDSFAHVEIEDAKILDNTARVSNDAIAEGLDVKADVKNNVAEAEGHSYYVWKKGGNSPSPPPPANPWGKKKWGKKKGGWGKKKWGRHNWAPKWGWKSKEE